MCRKCEYWAGRGTLDVCRRDAKMRGPTESCFRFSWNPLDKLAWLGMVTITPVEKGWQILLVGDERSSRKTDWKVMQAGPTVDIVARWMLRDAERQATLAGRYPKP
jgi:hypothetical protein